MLINILVSIKCGMVFINEIKISDIISIISLILVMAGGIFGYYQWRKSILLGRAEYINELTEKIRTDKYIKDVIYMFDYNYKWYTEQFHGSGKLELKVDKTLSYFSYICYLREQKIISDKEFNFFKYEINRILRNSQVQDYFYNLYHFSNKNNTPITFLYLFKYGEKIKILFQIFYDKNSYLYLSQYHRYINF